jgi:hypothetical protein
MPAGEEDAVGDSNPRLADSDCRLCGFTEPKINAPATRVAGAMASV